MKKLNWYNGYKGDIDVVYAVSKVNGNVVLAYLPPSDEYIQDKDGKLLLVEIGGYLTKTSEYYVSSSDYNSELILNKLDNIDYIIDNLKEIKKQLKKFKKKKPILKK